MSHFSVAVFTKENTYKEVERLLAPYSEDIEVAPYVDETKDQMIADAKKTKAYILQKLESGEEHQTSWDAYLNAETDDDFYNCICDEDDILDSDGNRMSTYNPNSKWDWYSIGGRWLGMLRLKAGATGQKGECGTFGNKADEDEYDSCLVSDIDFAAIKDAMLKKVEPFSECWERKFYKPQYFDEMYPTEESYIDQKTSFSTYAVITPDGQWHSVGDMGWFGVSSETPEGKKNFIDRYYGNFIVPAIENGWYITIVDCHI